MLIEKTDGCKNNRQNSSTTKVYELIPSVLSTISSSKGIENKHDVNKDKDCTKKFCECLRKYAMKIINFKKKKKLSFDYRFIIKDLAEEFKNKLTGLGENTEKYITFTVPREKEVTRIDKNGDEITKNIAYILQPIDNERIMNYLVNNLVEGIHKIKCIYRHDDKKCKICGIKYKFCNCFLQYRNIKDNLIKYKCLCCNKNYQKNFEENLKNNFLIHTNFLTMMSISLFNYCKKGSCPYE